MPEKTHWRSLGDPNFLGGFEFKPGQEMILTIKNVEDREVFNPGDKKKENARTCSFVENVKPMILNVTNSKTLSVLYKSNFVEDWAGRKFIVWFDPTVRVGREQVGGLRIKDKHPQINENSKVLCADCKSEVTATDKATSVQLASFTQKKYGRILCAKCARVEEDSKKTVDPLSEADKPVDTTTEEKIEDEEQKFL
jgi:hypothetical protein